VLSVLFLFTTSDYYFGIYNHFFWLLCCLSVFYLRLPITILVSSNISFDHCVFCAFSINDFRLLFWYLHTFLLTIVLSVRFVFATSYYYFGIFKLFFWPLCCRSIFYLRLPITTLVSTNISFDHCVVCPFSIYDFRLLFWYLQTFLLTIVFSVRFLFTTSDYYFGIFKLFFWPLCCLSFFYLRLPITILVSSNFSFGHCGVCPFSSTDYHYSFGIFTLFLHVIAFIYIFWLLCKLPKIFTSWWKSLLTLK
jgi:hypothetical protein